MAEAEATQQGGDAPELKFEHQEEMPPDARSARHWTTAVTALAAALMTLDITVVNVAMPEIGADLGASLDSLQWIVNAYTLSFAALLLTAGSVSDLIGRRRIFLAGVAVFTLASAACALAPNAGVLIAARAVQGAGGAMVLGTSLALISGVFEGAPTRARTTAIGLFTAGGAVSAALGPLVGGSIVEWLSWPWLFAVNVPLGLLIIYGTVRKVPEDGGTGGSRQIDYAGAILAVLALFLLNYGLLAGSEDGWSQADVLASLITGALLAVAFVAVQWRLGERAMLDLRLFAIPTFAGALLLSFAARIFSFGMLPFITLWLGGMLHLTPIEIGLVLLAQSVAIIIGAPLSGLLTKVVPVSRVLALGMAAVGTGVLLTVGISPDDDWTALLPMLVLIGVGAGLTLPHLLSLAVNVVPPSRAGTASGAANSFFPLGTATGVAAFGVVLTSKVNDVMSASALGEHAVPDSAAGQLRRLVTAGQFDAVAAAVPGTARGPVLSLARSAYTEALSQIFLIAGIAALVAAAASLVLVRDKDTYETPVTRE
ncbi:MFS transporter [Streptomyces sp. WAC04114]|uniref:MFS transporter n=1 Tax=Streptomyces sp. WAC04114 TaxID=2867961 RepID=UPI001C8B1768|nr:MFS transporter [Streptomyces sp. WAC04114]MBX9359666.1 MFS transporter [Streptomyces sp. WAC04114]